MANPQSTATETRAREPSEPPPGDAPDERPGASAGSVAGDAQSTAADVGEIARNIGGVVGDLAALVALEGRTAALSLVKIVALGLVAGFVILLAWIALSGALAFALVLYTQLGPALALAATAGANLIVAFAIWLTIRRLSRVLGFHHSRAALSQLLGQEGSRSEGAGR